MPFTLHREYSGSIVAAHPTPYHVYYKPYTLNLNLMNFGFKSGRWKNRQRKRVPEFTNVRDERVKILVNFCIRKMERIGMRRSRKTCASRPQERWRHAESSLLV